MPVYLFAFSAGPFRMVFLLVVCGFLFGLFLYLIARRFQSPGAGEALFERIGELA